MLISLNKKTLYFIWVVKGVLKSSSPMAEIRGNDKEITGIIDISRKQFPKLPFTYTPSKKKLNKSCIYMLDDSAPTIIGIIVKSFPLHKTRRSLVL